MHVLIRTRHAKVRRIRWILKTGGFSRLSPRLQRHFCTLPAVNIYNQSLQKSNSVLVKNTSLAPPTGHPQTARLSSGAHAGPTAGAHCPILPAFNRTNASPPNKSRTDISVRPNPKSNLSWSRRSQPHSDGQNCPSYMLSAYRRNQALAAPTPRHLLPPAPIPAATQSHRHCGDRHPRSSPANHCRSAQTAAPPTP